MSRPINQIAHDIIAAWGWSKIYFGARPYLEAMTCITRPADKYGQDDAASIVRYFLANARSFRGDEAKKLKAELKAAIGDK